MAVGIALGLFILWLGFQIGENRQKEIQLKSFHQDRYDYVQHLRQVIQSVEEERKLWVNTSLVRGGSPRIFKVEDKPTVQTKPQAENQPLESDILPPFSAQIQSWKKADADAKLSVVPQQTKDELNEVLDRIADEHNN